MAANTDQSSTDNQEQATQQEQKRSAPHATTRLRQWNRNLEFATIDHDMAR